MQAVFHTEIRLDDHTDRERERYVSDLLSHSSDKNKDSNQDPHNESHDEIEIALARQLINIGERSSIGRNAPLGRYIVYQHKSSVSLSHDLLSS